MMNLLWLFFATYRILPILKGRDVFNAQYIISYLFTPRGLFIKSH